MKTKYIYLAAAVLLVCRQAGALPLEEGLRAAAGASEKYKSAQAGSAVAAASIRSAQSGYFPDIRAEAIDSTGFPGSTGALGVGGVMGSPFRSGLGYGIVAVQPVFDAGRTALAVEAARSESDASKSQADIVLSSVLAGAADIYVECAQARSLLASWIEIKQLSEVAEKEVRRYVKTGQRSVVDEMLAKVQFEEAVRAEAVFQKQLEMRGRRLQAITASDKAECDRLEDLKIETFRQFQGSKSPLLENAKAGVRAADSGLKEARAHYYPKLAVVGSVGDFESARLVPKADYAVGIALSVPLFDGGRTNSEVERRSALVDQRWHEERAIEQFLDQANLLADEQIAAADAQLLHLEIELKTAVSALDVAKGRYFSLRGNLSDLREAIRNFARIRESHIKSRATLVRAVVSKALLNGWRPR